MKKILALIIAIVLTLSCISVCAQDSIAVLLDGEAISFDVEPQIINSRTMVPMRAIFTALGANVEWVEEHRLIVASKNASII
ncbi:MAG: copper amine oxidase, partial [Clostridia bacterium]|nr:copper amine oxidase [Clostridia bacterium]